jgi:hypothetical protein
MANLDFKASPTCAEFMKSESFGRLIAGPVGSGKTTACVIELLRRAVLQTPAKDGKRYTRFAIVRQTLKQLRDTVLKDAQQWLGHLGYWKVSESCFHLEFDDVVSELIFIPLEDAADQARLLSMQLTGAWLSEAIEMNYDVVGPVSGRIGRFPSGIQGTPTWSGIICDTNFPTELTPWHKFMTEPLSNWQIFTQPSGLAPNAENLNYLVQNEKTILLPINHPDRIAQGRRYYERFVETYGENSDWVKRYVKAQYGDDPSGLAVFKATWNTEFHTVDDTLLIPGYPLIVGQDFGRNPWSLICQVDHMGRLLVHEEVPATNVGLEKHVKESLIPRLMSDKYMGYKVMLVGDPSGIAKGSVSEESNFDALGRLGLPWMPAPTNDIDPRLRAVEAMLGRQIGGGKPALMVSRKGCPFLIRGMAGGYRFTKTKLGGLRAVPEKNDKEGFSHVADTLQYVCLVAHGGLSTEIALMLRPRQSKKRGAMPSSAWT